MAIGARDTRDIVVNTGVDASELKKFAIADGTTFEAIMQQMQGVLGAIRGEITGSPTFGALMNVTDQPEVSYRMGANGAFEDATEYGDGADQRATTDGHMLPIKEYDRKLSWTERFLRKANLEQVQNDIAAAGDALRDLYRIKLLTRLLKRGDDSGAGMGLGTSGFSPGFATTAGSTSVDFTPPDFEGKTFASTHEHYYPHAGSNSITTTAIYAAQEHLREHGHKPPYTLIGAWANRSVFEALSGFVKSPNPLVNYANSTAVATLTYEMFLGTIYDCQVMLLNGMPTTYAFLYKSYGPNSQRNPLRLRVPKGSPGLDIRVLAADGTTTLPLKGIKIQTEFGVGVGDRTNGVAIYSNNATWADGTPT